jgi:hypothetical protein
MGQLTGHEPSGNKPEIQFSLDEFDIDNYDFKPVTKGLGFHQKDPETKARRTTPSPIQRSSHTIKKDPPQLTKHPVMPPVPTTREQDLSLRSTPVSRPLESSRLVSGLESIYGQVPSSEKKIKKTLVGRKGKVEAASGFEAWFASSIDTLIVLLVLVGMNLAFYRSLTSEIILANFLQFIADYALMNGVLFFLVLTSYFTLFIPVGTLAERTLKLRVRPKKGKHVTLGMGFWRSIGNIIGLIALGVPFKTKFVDDVSETKLFRTNK